MDLKIGRGVTRQGMTPSQGYRRASHFYPGFRCAAPWAMEPHPFGVKRLPHFSIADRFNRTSTSHDSRYAFLIGSVVSKKCQQC
jgi:hypothetical protein